MSNDININPWKTLTSERVHDSPQIGVTKHDVLNPNGNPGTYSVIHFKNITLGILQLDKDYNTWIVGQYRFPINQYSWYNSSWLQIGNTDTLKNLCPGAYHVIIKDSIGCSLTDTASATVSIGNNPFIIITQNLTIQNGQSTIITATGGALITGLNQLH